jgi:hypothetical protein
MRKAGFPPAPPIEEEEEEEVSKKLNRYILGSI